jgi:hypothetical protein
MAKYGKNGEIGPLSLNTYVQYVEDFKFWVMVAGNTHRIPEKEIAKLFVSGLKPDIFREEIYARSCESLVDAMAETRNELSNYREFMEISDRIKRPEVKKDSKDRIPECLNIQEIREQHQGSYWGAFRERLEEIEFREHQRCQGCRVFQVSQEGTLR